MDSTRFDEFTKALAAPTSRRRALKTFAASIVGGILGLSKADPALASGKCLGLGSKCTHGDQCCSGTCTNKRCACPSGQTNCNGTCCSSSQFCCGTTCCPNGQACCNGTCCAAGQICIGGTCISCGPTTCAGCCDASGTCQPGTSSGACGSGGGTCSSCATGQTCVSGKCVCNASSCPTGCCDASTGTCQPGTSTGACGSGGAACVSCGTGQTCQNGACTSTCGASTCPNGCCDASGNCVSGTSNSACGAGGLACADCAINGQVCLNGACCPSSQVCGTVCCSSGSCCSSTCTNTQTDPNNCGVCGNVCPQGTTCLNGMCVSTCNATNCPNGCCDSTGHCQVNNAMACGSGGGMCVTCNLPNATSACVNGQCTIASCNAGFADCNGNPADGCETNLQTDPSNCGACGNVCSSTNGTPTCTMGQCQITCNAGFFNCNGNSADGCECQGTGCCGSTCQFQHSNGVGQTYYDCFPPGQPGNPATYNSQMAQDACNAFTAVNGGICSQLLCGSNVVMAGENQTSCVTWQFTGTLAGFVFQSSSSTCFCPTASSPTWN